MIMTDNIQRKATGMRYFIGAVMLLLTAVMLLEMKVNAAEQTQVMVTTMECSVWSAPQTLEANRVKKVAVGYEITVIPTEITGADDKVYYQTVKGKYILCKCVVLPGEEGTQTQQTSSENTRQVGSFAMVQCQTTTNGTPIYFYSGQRPDHWYTIWNITRTHRLSDRTTWEEQEKKYVDQYPGMTNWPDYLLAAANECGVTPSMSDYEKAVTVAHYLANRISYGRSATNMYNFTYGAMTENLAVCAGYTNTYYNMMHMFGIECYYESGKGLTGGNSKCHAWNRIVTGGTSYYVDVTWTRGSGSDRYLMMSALPSDHILEDEYDFAYADILWLN